MAKGSSKELDYDQLSEKLLELEDTKKLVSKEKREYGSTEHQEPPDNHLKSSLFAILLCCPCGLIAYINALLVNRRFRTGHVEGAYSASRRAERYSYLALHWSLIFWMIVALVVGSAALYGFFYGIDKGLTQS